MAEAKFQTQENSDGESDRRVKLEPGKKAAPTAASGGQVFDRKLANANLDAVAGYAMSHSDDEMAKLGFNRVHIGIVKELAERRAKGKNFALSDGNCEMLFLFHQRMQKEKLIK